MWCEILSVPLIHTLAFSFLFNSSVCRLLFEFLWLVLRGDVVLSLMWSMHCCSVYVWSTELRDWHTLGICTGLWANKSRVDGWRRKASSTRTPVSISDYADRGVTESVFHISPCNSRKWWLLIHSKHLGLVVPQSDRFRPPNGAFPAGMLLEFKHKLCCIENKGRKQGRVGDRCCSKLHFGRNMMGALPSQLLRGVRGKPADNKGNQVAPLR